MEPTISWDAGAAVLRRAERELASSAALHPSTLSDSERASLFEDGFIVLKRVVTADAVAQARALIDATPPEKFYTDRDAAHQIAQLYTAGALQEILESVMGPHTPPIQSQVAATPTGGGYPGPNPAHVDGGWAGEHPMSVGEILASGESLDRWGEQDDPRWLGPAGSAPLWQDPDKKSAIGSFTAFAGVCLSDQLQPDMGQFSVHRGAHEPVEAFFRRQRDAGGPLGGGGPFWPRLIGDRRNPEGRAYAGVMPGAMTATYPDKVRGENMSFGPVLFQTVKVIRFSLPRQARDKFKHTYV
eukprot:COSAG06_NODE_3222_length_5656_cov_36.417132_1_plen_299_part_00